MGIVPLSDIGSQKRYKCCYKKQYGEDDQQQYVFSARCESTRETFSAKLENGHIVDAVVLVFLIAKAHCIGLLLQYITAELALIGA